MVPEDVWQYMWSGKSARQRLYDIDAKTDNIQTAVSDLQVKGASRHAAVLAKIQEVLDALQES